jgi:hypothetical protein
MFKRRKAPIPIPMATRRTTETIAAAMMIDKRVCVDICGISNLI